MHANNASLIVAPRFTDTWEYSLTYKDCALAIVLATDASTGLLALQVGPQDVVLCIQPHNPCYMMDVMAEAVSAASELFSGTASSWQKAFDALGRRALVRSTTRSRLRGYC